ncbi:hypothetical protein [Kocuria marina]|nr:hypothetical protein [Kocuria marina]
MKGLRLTTRGRRVLDAAAVLAAALVVAALLYGAPLLVTAVTGPEIGPGI